MQIIQPHYHGIARTAQDYERMAMSGVVAVAEPAFWAGFDRAYPETFLDYFRQISEFEPTRAAQYGIRHFCWVAVNPKEAENPPLSREVMRHMPDFFRKPTVLGVGEIGFHKTTKNEEAIFEEQLAMAIEYHQLVLIHTPHLQDKVRGTAPHVGYSAPCADRSGAGLDRSCRGTHDARAPGGRVLGRLHTVSHHQVFAQARCRHARTVWLRASSGELVSGLGTQ